MPIQRVFLGWDGACLPRAVRWLEERYGQSGPAASWDLSAVALVTPGRRSGRRLLELIVAAAGARVLVPPGPQRIMTPAGLFDLLVDPAALPGPGAGALPGGRLADEVEATLARMHALRQAPPAVLARVVPVPPGAKDLRGWLALAEDVQRLHDTLASDGVTFDDAVARCQQFDDFNDEERWAALAALQRDYEGVLARQGLVDRRAAQRSAAGCLRAEPGVDVVLLATPDLPGYVRPLLRATPARVFALIHAPEGEAEAFDDVGCLIPEQWAKRRVELDEAQMKVVDRPRDQAAEVVETIVGLAMGAEGAGAAESVVAHASPSPGVSTRHPLPGGEGVSPDQVTVGLGDETMAPLIERTLELAGVPARPAGGRRLVQTRPGLFLDAWGQYLRTRRFDSLAALLRHPDVEGYLHRTIGDQAGPALDGWLTLLDRYLTKHVQGEVSEGWLGDPAQAAPLEAARAAIDRLAPPDSAGTTLPLPHWSQTIVTALQHLYAWRPLNRYEPADAALIEALKMIGPALAAQARVAPEDESTSRLDLADAVALTLGRLRDAALPPTGETAGPAVELLGWLELPLDDAPALIITGVNERSIPESVNHDAFLPDRLRHALGLVDNQRRYARDLCSLTAILHSRPFVRLISGRRSAQNDPLTPSRLLLACAPEDLPARVCKFYDEAGDAPSPPGRGWPVLRPGEGEARNTGDQVGNSAPNPSRFRLPFPIPPAKPVEELEVTAFRDYLACPYRFYLTHIVKLEPLDDAAVEMPPSAFGSLAHEVLDELGQDDLAASDDAEMIAKFLSARLEARCRRRFGTHPPAAVTIQREQLRQRLGAFANWQAKQARDGWRLVGLPEKKLVANLDVDGTPLRLRGRLDRIDQHPDGRLRIIDYKTGDAGKSPEETHRAGDAWVDLQLPLYRLLAREAGLKGPTELGYLVLPKKLGDVGFLAAKWDEAMLGTAEAEARRIVRAIRNNVFWPPSPPPKYDDGLGAICMDRCTDRQRVIREMTAEMQGGAK